MVVNDSLLPPRGGNSLYPKQASKGDRFSRRPVSFEVGLSDVLHWLYTCYTLQTPDGFVVTIATGTRLHAQLLREDYVCIR